MKGQNNSVVSAFSSFILDIPKGMSPKAFAGKFNREKFSECYGEDISPEDFFKEHFGRKTEFTAKSVVDHVFGVHHTPDQVLSRVIPADPNEFFEMFNISVDEWREKPFIEIVSGLIKDYNLYELSVERGYDYRGVFGDLILFEDNC